MRQDTINFKESIKKKINFKEFAGPKLKFLMYWNIKFDVLVKKKRHHERPTYMYGSVMPLWVNICIRN